MPQSASFDRNYAAAPKAPLRRRVLHHLAGLWLLLCSTILWPAAMAADAGKTVPAPRTLIVYTTDRSTPLGSAGRLYAILLYNLLGHFPVRVDIASLESADVEMLRAAEAVFFIGYAKNKKLPTAFVQAMLNRKKLTVWLKHGIDQAIAADSERKLGFDFLGVRGFDGPIPSNGNNPGFFDVVTYKERIYAKYYHFDKRQHRPVADPDLVRVEISDRTHAISMATIANSKSGERAPWVTRSGAFWFVAEIPFTYTGPRDRHLVFTDLLHDMLGVPPADERHLALLRLEDVHPLRSADAIDKISALLWSRRVPFSIGVIPYYRDPHGVERGPKAVTLKDPRAAALVSALKRAVARGGAIVQHGTTHQFGQLRNPLGISGKDYEFWDIVRMRPIPELESEDATRKRLLLGRCMLEEMGLAPFAFQMPHYQGSPLAYRVVGALYPSTYQRVTYYSSDTGQVGPSALSEAWLGQAFPFAIARDYYGQKVLPDNIGHLSYDAPTESAADILLNAEYVKTVRGGVASFIFHPYLLEGPRARTAIRDLDRVIKGLQARGFKFVGAKEFGETLGDSARSRTAPCGQRNIPIGATKEP